MNIKKILKKLEESDILEEAVDGKGEAYKQIRSTLTNLILDVEKMTKSAKTPEEKEILQTIENNLLSANTKLRRLI